MKKGFSLGLKKYTFEQFASYSIRIFGRMIQLIIYKRKHDD